MLVLLLASGPRLAANNLGALDLLSRLNHEIAFLQKQRDDSRRSLGKAHDPPRIQEMDETSALEHERGYSCPQPESGRYRNRRTA